MKKHIEHAVASGLIASAILLTGSIVESFTEATQKNKEADLIHTMLVSKDPHIRADGGRLAAQLYPGVENPAALVEKRVACLEKEKDRRPGVLKDLPVGICNSL